MWRYVTQGTGSPASIGWQVQADPMPHGGKPIRDRLYY